MEKRAREGIFYCDTFSAMASVSRVCCSSISIKCWRRRARSFCAFSSCSCRCIWEGADPAADPGVDPGVDAVVDLGVVAAALAGPGVDRGVVVEMPVDPASDPVVDAGVDPGVAATFAAGFDVPT